MKKSRHLSLVAAVMVGMILGGWLVAATGFGVRGGSTVSAIPAAAPLAAKSNAKKTYLPEDVVEKVAPAVVTVINEQTYSDESGSQIAPVGSGTGFIIDEQGHIVTNWHVVDGGEKFEVILESGESRPAELIGSDPVSDIAVVRIDGELPGIVTFGDSDKLRPGQPVLAIGSPLGDFTNTVTEGIVSALGRDFPITNVSQNYSNLIQHDAPVNPGNSGGPLFTLSAEVVGVNTLSLQTDDYGAPVQGIFFAIPSNTVQQIAAKLIETGKVIYPYFGIDPISVTPSLAANYQLPADHGVYVRHVYPGGPAAQAQILVGDIILSINGEEINQQSSFMDVLFQYAPGTTIEVRVQRGQSQLTLKVTLGQR